MGRARAVVVASAGALAAVAFAPGLARGQLIGQPPNHFGGPAADTDFINMFGQQSWQQLAEDFTLSAPADIRKIRWWGFYDQDNPPASETMRIRFYAARPGDGLPGAVLQETTLSSPSRIATGLIVQVGINPHEYRYEAILPALFSAAAGVPYWIEIVQVGDVSTHFRWEDSGTGDDRYVFLNRIVADWTESTLHVDLAYQLVAVPESSTVTLLLSALAWMRRSLKR
ncbi:MAG: hypothetical protein U1A27_02225 [Phycisphaerae bacterium]